MRATMWVRGARGSRVQALHLFRSLGLMRAAILVLMQQAHAHTFIRPALGGGRQTANGTIKRIYAVRRAGMPEAFADWANGVK